jgi:uracil-DNA glycosylase family 4
MFIGEGPGADEDQAGMPFQGGAGRILTAWCIQAGIRRDDCYLDNVIQHRPPDNNIDLASLPDEVPSLFRRILRVNPKLIVLLGNTALQVFVQGQITDWQGSYFPITIGGKTFKAVAVLHPAYIMRQRRLWDFCIAVLKKAKRLASTPGPYQEPKSNYNTDPTPTEFQRFVDEACDTDADLTLDIETDLQGTAVDLIGLGIRPGEALVVRPDNDFTVRLLLKLFGRCRRITTQNGWSFDIPRLRDNGFPVGATSHDTLLCSHLLYPYLPRSLAFLISMYTDFKYHKDQFNVRKEWYCCRDVDATQIIRDYQVQELEELGMVRLFKNVMRYAAVVMQMKQHGMQIDLPTMQALHGEKLQEEAKNTIIMQQMTGDKYFNPLSPQQVAKAWQGMGYALPYNRKLRRYNLDKNMIKNQLELAKRINDQRALQFLQGLQQVRSDRKLASTYYSCPVDDKSRIHPNWKMASQADEEDEDLK